MRAYRHPIMRPLTSCWASSLTRSSGPRRRFSQSVRGGARGVAPLAPPRPSRRSLLFRLLRSRGQAAVLHHDDGERLDDVAVLVELDGAGAVSYTHLRAHETRHDLVCRLLLEKKKKKTNTITKQQKLTTKKKKNKHKITNK